MRSLDPSEQMYLEDDTTPMMQTIKCATMELLSGAALPGLRTLKMPGNYGLTFASNQRGLLYRCGQLLNYGEKRNLVDSALSAGAAVAVTSTLLDAGGQITRTDNGKEYAV
ncbi:hypothetical protein MKW98_011321 [Papaver atlanticum]|uniref:Uncharacterized protein n=1 Tax=Papaver atlanticum TaxID=357466 RepID=A0AAD4SW52_9MAGN|nr:hypothetical protein MKW98_011321 [Papaver atlanticum]